MNQDNQISAETREIIQRFNDVFLHHNPDALTELVAENCVIEAIRPAPNGLLHVGREACLAIWQDLAAEASTQFELEEAFIAGDRAVVRWRYQWGDNDRRSIRGVNLMRVRQGAIIEAMGYVKGQ